MSRIDIKGTFRPR